MDLVWYFAYGSNLNTDVFRGRRGIECRRALPARLPGWRLVFDKPPLFPIGESYANLSHDAEALAFGVLYEITADDLAHIDLTEGVPMDNYTRIEVQVAPLRPLDGVAAAVAAHTLVSAKRDPSLLPSHRYMELIIDGARAHGLPQEHIEHLLSIPSRPSTPEAEALRRQIDELMRRSRR